MSLIPGGDSPDELALVRVSGHDSQLARLQSSQGGLPNVEAQTGHPLVLIGSVAGVAVVGKDGTNVAVEFERWALPGLGCPERVEDPNCRGQTGQNPGAGLEKEQGWGSQAAHGWQLPPPEDGWGLSSTVLAPPAEDC